MAAEAQGSAGLNVEDSASVRSVALRVAVSAAFTLPGFAFNRYLSNNEGGTKMSEQAGLEAMTCEELLRELARLSSERDHTHADVATPSQASDEQAPQVAGMLDQSARIERIGELLKAKKCQEMPR
jgi:hypothetical protein